MSHTSEAEEVQSVEEQLSEVQSQLQIAAGLDKHIFLCVFGF